MVIEETASNPLRQISMPRYVGPEAQCHKSRTPAVYFFFCTVHPRVTPGVLGQLCIGMCMCRCMVFVWG